MLKYCLTFLFLICSVNHTLADEPAQTVDLKAIVNQHILARYQGLVQQAEQLEAAAEASCGIDPDVVKKAYHTAFDAWIGVSHLRFGPSEKDDRAFALAFWPDSKGFTPKTLRKLLKGDDPALTNLSEFQKVSIAGRGFFALDFLLFDEAFTEKPAKHYCDLVKLISKDIVANTKAILSEWQSDYAKRLSEPGNDTFRNDREAVTQIYTALTTGLEFSAQSRIARPMGSFKKPRPRRAEAWRSGRSLRNVVHSLEATRELAGIMSKGDPDIDGRFANALKIASALNDPTFASVATIQGRIRVEALQSAIMQILDLLEVELAARLGIGAGFNALDGD